MGKAIAAAVAIAALVGIFVWVGGNESPVTNGTFNAAENRLNRRLDSLEILLQEANRKLDALDAKVDRITDTINARAEELRNGQKYIANKIDSIANNTNTNTLTLW